MKQRRSRKNCPECRYYNKKFPNMGCTKNPERDTYSKLTLPKETKEREWCTEYMRKKK